MQPVYITVSFFCCKRLLERDEKAPRMVAYDADFRRLIPHMDVPAVGTDPDCILLLPEQYPALQFICKSPESFSVDSFDPGYVLEDMGDFRIAFFLRDQTEVPVHILPFLVFIALCRPQQLKGTVVKIHRVGTFDGYMFFRSIPEQFVKDLGMRSLLVCRIIENCLDILQTFLPGK